MLLLLLIRSSKEAQLNDIQLGKDVELNDNQLGKDVDIIIINISFKLRSIVVSGSETHCSVSNRVDRRT